MNILHRMYHAAQQFMLGSFPLPFFKQKLQRAESTSIAEVPTWPCPGCGERLEESFDTCWKCGTMADGSSNPEWQPGGEAAQLGPGEEDQRHFPRPGRHLCPDCDVPLVPIQLVAGNHMGGMSDVHYTSDDAVWSPFKQTYPVHGSVSGRMCNECGRILLYAERG